MTIDRPPPQSRSHADMYAWCMDTFASSGVLRWTGDWCIDAEGHAQKRYEAADDAVARAQAYLEAHHQDAI